MSYDNPQYIRGGSGWYHFDYQPNGFVKLLMLGVYNEDIRYTPQHPQTNAQGSVMIR